MSGSLELGRWKESHTTRCTNLLYRSSKVVLLLAMCLSISLLGYRLEVPCIYSLYGPKAYVERAKAMFSGDLSQMRSSGVSGLSQN